MKREVKEFLKRENFSSTNTVVMLTAVPTALVAINEFSAPFGSIIVAVTAGVGNAVDVSRVHERQDDPYIGTINTWVIVNGCLSEEAFFQALMTATEAKTKALQSENIRDERSGTIDQPVLLILQMLLHKLLYYHHKDPLHFLNCPHLYTLSM